MFSNLSVNSSLQHLPHNVIVNIKWSSLYCLTEHEKCTQKFDLSCLSSWTSNYHCQHLSPADKIWVVILGKLHKFYEDCLQPILENLSVINTWLWFYLLNAFLLYSHLSCALLGIFALFLATIIRPPPPCFWLSLNYSLAFSLFTNSFSTFLPEWSSKMKGITPLLRIFECHSIALRIKTELPTWLDLSERSFRLCPFLPF